MTRITAFKFTAVAFALMFLLAACGSGEESGALPDNIATVPVPAPTTEAPAADAPTTTNTFVPQIQEPTGTAEERSPEEAAQNDLDVMIAQLLGTENLLEISDCIVERLDSEGVPLTGQGSPELAALIGCEPGAIDRLITLDPTLADEPTRICLTAGIATWIGGLPLEEAQVFFQSPVPPDELVTLLGSICNLTVEEVETILVFG